MNRERAGCGTQIQKKSTGLFEMMEHSKQSGTLYDDKMSSNLGLSNTLQEPGHLSRWDSSSSSFGMLVLLLQFPLNGDRFYQYRVCQSKDVLAS